VRVCDMPKNTGRCKKSIA